MVQSLITHEKLIPDHFNLIFHDFAITLETYLLWGKLGNLNKDVKHRRNRHTHSVTDEGSGCQPLQAAWLLKSDLMLTG